MRLSPYQALTRGSALLEFGAGNETRTRDPDLGKVVLYQLSYSRGRTRIMAMRRILSTLLVASSAALGQIVRVDARRSCGRTIRKERAHRLRNAFGRRRMPPALPVDEPRFRVAERRHRQSLAAQRVRRAIAEAQHDRATLAD